MIIFLTLCYVAPLAILIKLKVIKASLWWKLSPLVWMIVLFFALFIPMQFWAPGGRFIVYQHSVPIVPNVSGQVTEVPVKPNVDVKFGDVLFKIDPVPYVAARDQIEARLKLARFRLRKFQKLTASGAAALDEIELGEAQVKELEASLAKAEYDLEHTVVRAPSDGFVTNLALRPGVRVGAMPMAQVMAFVEESERGLGAQIMQGHLRYVEHEMEAEVTLKLFPGEVHKATVEYVVRASASGQILPSGTFVTAKEVTAAPFAVRLRLNDQTLMNNLPAGAVGSVAIYTKHGKATHIIRKVMIRMDAYMNYLIPF